MPEFICITYVQMPMDAIAPQQLRKMPTELEVIKCKCQETYKTSALQCKLLLHVQVYIPLPCVNPNFTETNERDGMAGRLALFLKSLLASALVLNETSLFYYICTSMCSAFYSGTPKTSPKLCLVKCVKLCKHWCVCVYIYFY